MNCEVLRGLVIAILQGRHVPNEADLMCIQLDVVRLTQRQALIPMSYLTPDLCRDILLACATGLGSAQSIAFIDMDCYKAWLGELSFLSWLVSRSYWLQSHAGHDYRLVQAMQSIELVNMSDVVKAGSFNPYGNGQTRRMCVMNRYPCGEVFAVMAFSNGRSIPAVCCGVCGNCKSHKQQEGRPMYVVNARGIKFLCKATSRVVADGHVYSNRSPTKVWIYTRGGVEEVSIVSSRAIPMGKILEGSFNPYGNGQTSQRGWKRVTHRAYLFDEARPSSIKFDEGDAQRYLRSVKDHQVVRKLGEEKVVKLMMKRRGVKPSVAFKLVIDNYLRLHVEAAALEQGFVGKIEQRFIPHSEAIDWGSPVGRAVWALADGMTLNRSQRRLLRLAPRDVVDDVQKKSGIVKKFLSSLTPEVTIGLSNESTSKLDRFSESIASLGTSFKEGTKSVVDSIDGAISGVAPKVSIEYVAGMFGISATDNPLMMKLLKVIRDILVVWSVDGIGATLATATLIAEANQSSTYAAMLTGCVVIMKQFTKWCNKDLVDKKGLFDRTEDASIFEPLLRILSTTVFGVYNNIPKFNGIFTFGKNLSTASDYLISAVKQGINLIYRTATGYDLFELPLAKLSREIKLLMANISAGVAGDLTHDDLSSVKKQLQALRTYQSRAIAAGLDKDSSAKISSFVRVTEQVVSHMGVEVENRKGRGRTVVYGLYGKTGVGKTSICEAISLALGKVLGWAGSPNDWHAVFKLASSESGFQPVLSVDCKSLQVDEPFCNNDQKVVADEVKTFLLLVSSSPIQMEGAAVEDKNNFIRPQCMALTYNTVNPKTGTVNPEAVHRRIDFKFELVCNVPDLYGELEYAKINDIVTFRTVERDYTFQEVVSALADSIRKNNAGSVKMDLLKAEIMDKFEALKGVAIKKPKSMMPDQIKRKRRVPSIDPDMPVLIESDDEFTSAESDVEKKAFFKPGPFWDRLKLGIPIDDANKAVEDYSDFAIDGSPECVKKCAKEIFADAKIESSGQLVSAIRESFGINDEPEKFIAFTGDDCVFSSDGCVTHTSHLRCNLRLKQHAARGDVPKAIDPVSVYSYLLEAGRWIGDRVFDVLLIPIGLGLIIGSFLFPFLLLVGLSVLTTLCTVFVLEIVARIVLWLFPSLDSRPKQKAYGNQYAVQARPVGDIPRFLPESAQDVAQKGEYVIAAKDGIQEAIHQTCRRILAPVQFVYETGTSVQFCRVQLHAIQGRLCATVKHAFTYQSYRPTKMILPAPWNKVLEVKNKDGYDKKDVFVVQTIYHMHADATFVILPVGLNIFPNIKKRFMTVRDFNPSLMNSMALYYKQFVDLSFDDAGNVTCSDKPMSLMSLPNGVFKTISDFTYKDGTKASGVEFSQCPEPSDGVCGGPVLPLNPRFGGGGRIFGLMYCGHSKRRESAFCFYILQEDVDMILSMYPDINGKVVIEDHTGLELKDVDASFVKKASVATAPRRGFVPSDPGIYPSLVFDALTNAEFVVDGKLVKMPPTERVPSTVREIEKGFAKYPPFIAHTSPALVDDLIAAAKDVASTQIGAAKGYPYRRNGFLSIDEALNGTIDGQVQPLNMDSSHGYSGVYKGKRSDKYEFCYVDANGLKHIKKEFEAEAEFVFQGVLNGTYYMNYLKTTSKGELRPPGKVVRLVSAQHFLYLLAVRRIFAPVQAAMAYGAPKNGTARAVDPTGPDGEVMWKYIHSLLNKFAGDAKKFDASQRSEVALLCLPLIWAQWLVFIYPHLKIDHAIQIATVIVLLSHLGYEIVENDVYLHLDGNISGTLTTTDRNDCITGLAIRLAWIFYFRANHLAGNVFEEFHKCVRYVSQGDDIAGCSSVNFGNFDLQKGYNAIGITYTSAAKELVESQFDPDVDFLKREAVQFHGHVIGRLPLVVIHEILSYVRTKIMSREDATLVNVEAAFRELFLYGEDAYEKSRTIINVALAANNCGQFIITYDDMLRTWTQKFSTELTELTLPSAVKSLVQSERSSADVMQPFDVIKKGAYKQGPACCTWVITINGANVYSRMPVKNRVASNMTSSDSTSKVETDGSDRSVVQPILKELVGLTTNSDILSKSVTQYQSTTAKILGRLDPYPDQQVQKILTRQYPIGSFAWGVADASGLQLATFRFPETLFAIPKIAATLSAFRYFSAKVLVTFRVTGSPFHLGRLMIRALPVSGTDNWRNQFATAINSPHVNLSPNSGTAAEILLPWVCPKNLKDLQNAGEVGYGGVVECYVHHQLDSVAATTADPLDVYVFAQFVDPVVAGLDLTSAPAMDVVKKSGISEAFSKVTQGVLSGVKDATSTVEGLLAPLGGVAAMAGSMLDKPMTIAAPHPVTLRQGSDMVSTKGLFQGVVLGADPKAMVSVDPEIMGSRDPMGKLHELIQRPGMVRFGDIDVYAAVGTTVFDIPVKPNYVYPTGVNTYGPHPLGYYSQFFRFWRGGLKYYLIVSSSKMVTARWQIAFYPNGAAWGSSVPPQNQLGDITTESLTINGDTEWKKRIPWIGSTEYKAVESFGESETNAESCIGRLVCWVASPGIGMPGMSASAKMSWTLYVAADDTFQLLMPDAWEDGYEPDFADLADDVDKKGDIVEVFSKDFPSFVPTEKVIEKGLCSPDSVLSVTELLKRFELMSSTATSIAGTVVNTGPDGWPLTSWHFWLIAPFLTWRGGSNYKVVKSDFSAATCNWFAAAWEMSAGATLQPTLSGRLAQHVEVNPVLEFNVPFYDQMHCREVYPNLSQLPVAPKIVLSSDGSDASELYSAVADDFSLGQFIGPPLVQYTAPPVVGTKTRGVVQRLPGVSKAKFPDTVKSQPTGVERETPSKDARSSAPLKFLSKRNI